MMVTMWVKWSLGIGALMASSAVIAELDTALPPNGVQVVQEDDAASIKGGVCVPFGYWTPPLYTDCGSFSKDGSLCPSAPVHFFGGSEWGTGHTTRRCTECGNACGSYRVTVGSCSPS